MLLYHGYINYKHKYSPKTFTRRDCAHLVAEDVERWWGPVGIELKTHNGIISMILSIEDRYIKLKKNINRKVETEINKREEFLKDLKNTLWVIDKKTEERLKNSTDPKCQEDWEYLESVRGPNPFGTIGGIDTQDKKKKKRKRTREEQAKRSINKKYSSSQCNLQSTSSESEEEFDIHDTEFESKIRTPKPKKIRKPKKMQVISPEVLRTADKYGTSNRELFEMVGASTSNIKSQEKVLSVNSVRRKRLEYTQETSKKELSDVLSKPSAYYIIHWDGKKFKALQHCKENQEKLAVLLTTSNGDEILLGIIPVVDGTAAEEHKSIINLLKEKEINLKKIVGGVFDTTSVNTGELSGIVRRLEDSIGHSILELACRHHIYELVCGAASEIILGKTNQGKEQKKSTSPYEPIFKQLCKSWSNIEKSKLEIFNTKSFSRTLISDIREAKKFLISWLENEKSIREDYLEMAKLCLVYIGGELPKKYSKLKLRAPSAYHHARWMSKVLYVLKIAMLNPTFVENIEEIRSLALFYSVYYARAWLTSMFAADAPLQDLTCIKNLEKVCNDKGKWPELFQRIARAAFEKLILHTWYLSERLVPLVLFSDKLDNSDKDIIRSAILDYESQQPQHKEQQRPECTSFIDKGLKRFVGPDSYRLFELLRINKEFLRKPASKWSTCKTYKHAVEAIKLLPVVNDPAERVLGMATQMHGQTMPKSEKDCQARYQVVHSVRKFQSSIATSSERVTKKNHNEFLKWSQLKQAT